MLKGILIAESLQVGATLTGIPLRVDKVWRAAATTATEVQPPHWTLLEFEADEADADKLATALSEVLAPEGWYADFHTDVEVFVVFTDRVFRYLRGDAAGRAEAQEYARSINVPEPQLDWAE